MNETGKRTRRRVWIGGDFERSRRIRPAGNHGACSDDARTIIIITCLQRRHGGGGCGPTGKLWADGDEEWPGGNGILSKFNLNVSAYVWKFGHVTLWWWRTREILVVVNVTGMYGDDQKKKIYIKKRIRTRTTNKWGKND